MRKARPTFLPALRGAIETTVFNPGESKAVSVAFAQYYSDLATHNLHRRARDWPIERAVAEGYDRVIWVFKSVNTIGGDTAGLPFRLRQGEDEVDDHPLYEVLNKKANPLETGHVFRKRLSAQVLLSKRGAFVEVTKSNGGYVKRMDLLPPDRTEIIPGKGDDLVSHYRLTRRDGTIKNIPPENVRWFRDPHPIDPYMGVTPLESMGMSVELDHFARLYNVSFMQNDGRPGGVLAVRKTDGTGGDIDPAHMNRLEERFGKGPVEAGKLSVVAGELSYVDLAARPRDMQYGATSRNAKIEILSGFGVPESVLGYSAERTFDNADNELYVYWTRTLPEHHKTLLTGFDEDSEDDLVGYFDTSEVEVLERATRAKREEARTEVEKGLRSIISYAQIAGYEDEIDDTPHTRALYIPTGKTPIPSREEDAEALGLATPVEDGADAGAPPPGPDGAPPPPGSGGDPATPPPAPALGGTETPGAPATAPPATPAPPAGTPGAAAAALAAVAGTKGLPMRSLADGGGRPRPKVVIRVSRKDGEERTTDPDLLSTDEFEVAVADALTGLAERWTERAVARLGSPKQRKHTRHWIPEYDDDTRMGTKALDAARAVDEDTWQVEAEDTLHPLVQAAAVAAAVTVFADLGLTPPPGVSAATMAAQAVTGTVTAVVGMIGRSAATQARRIVAKVNEADQDGWDLTAIMDLIPTTEKMTGWAKGLAIQVATATTNGSRDDAAREVNRDEHLEISRVWVSRRDDKVRFTHDRKTGADGQVRGLDEPFIVGDTLLRFPGDPLGPHRETANCRCYLRHRSRRTGRWMSPPQEKRFRRGPRDGDGDGWVEDGTPRQRRVVAIPMAIPARPVGPAPAPEDDESYLIRPGTTIPHVMLSTAERIADAVTVQARTRTRMAPDPDTGVSVLVHDDLDHGPDVAALLAAARAYDTAQESGDDAVVAAATPGLIFAAVAVRAKFWEVLNDDTRDALERLTRLVAVVAPEGKAAPRDGDRDGFIEDGTPRQRPAPRRGARVGTVDMNRDSAWTAGYDATYAAMKDEDVDVLERAVRDLDALMATQEHNSPMRRTLSGGRAALTRLHEEREAVDTDAKPVYAEPVSDARNPDFGKRIGDPKILADGTVVEVIGGRKPGQQIERVLYRVQRRDGVWGVYPPTEQSPAVFMTGSKAEARKWAMDRANGIPEPDEDAPSPRTKPAKRSRATVEHISRPDRQFAVEVRLDGDVLTVDGVEYGTLVKDVKRPTRQEWVLTVNGRVRTFPTKYAAMFEAGKDAPLPAVEE